MKKLGLNKGLFGIVGTPTKLVDRNEKKLYVGDNVTVYRLDGITTLFNGVVCHESGEDFILGFRGIPNDIFEYELYTSFTSLKPGDEVDFLTVHEIEVEEKDELEELIVDAKTLNDDLMNIIKRLEKILEENKNVSI